jgi:hypothetical protein
MLSALFKACVEQQHGAMDISEIQRAQGPVSCPWHRTVLRDGSTCLEDYLEAQPARINLIKKPPTCSCLAVMHNLST